jgi:pimeloyl-ACP methyl ester carboxylesterase
MRGEFVDVAGIRVYYYAAGTRGAGETVVLLHGFPMSSRLWHAVVRDFPPGHRLVVCDLPGYGRSDPPRDQGISSSARTILGLLDDLRIPRACLVGHALGGTIALRVASQAPTRVSHLALISTPPPGGRPKRMARLARALLPLARVAPPGFLAGLVQGSLLDGFADRERSRLTLDTCLHHFTTASGRDQLAAHLRDLSSATDGAQIDSQSDAIAKGGAVPLEALPLRIPTAILWGAKDPFLPPAVAARLQAALSGSTLEILPDASHFVPEDAPQRVVGWLRELLTTK